MLANFLALLPPLFRVPPGYIEPKRILIFLQFLHELILSNNKDPTLVPPGGKALPIEHHSNNSFIPKLINNNQLIQFLCHIDQQFLFAVIVQANVYTFGFVLGEEAED